MAEKNQNQSIPTTKQLKDINQPKKRPQGPGK
jgi:hypothetical protein